MILYIVRHAWAGHYGDPAWPDDSLRPLSDEGRERYACVAAQLVQRGVRPTLILSSPYVRCAQTADLLAAAVTDLDQSVQPRRVDRTDIEPGADPSRTLDWTARNAGQHDQIAWVGHAPDVGLLAAALIGSPDAAIRFPKGAIAAIDFDGPIAPNQGELRWLITAKLLGY